MQGIRKAGAYAITADGGVTQRTALDQSHPGVAYPCLFEDGKIVTGASVIGLLPDGGVYFLTNKAIYEGGAYFTSYILEGVIARAILWPDLVKRINDAKRSKPHDTGTDSGTSEDPDRTGERAGIPAGSGETR